MAQAAIEEMRDENEEGRTAFGTVVAECAPVELLKSMVELDGEIMYVGHSGLQLAAMHRSDTAAIKLLARDDPGGLQDALEVAEVAAVVSLLRKCLASWERGEVGGLIELCGESEVLLGHKEFVEKYPVHHAAGWAGDVEVIKPVIKAHAAKLVAEDEDSDTPLDYAVALNVNQEVVAFMDEADCAFLNSDIFGLIRLCGKTPYEKEV